MSFRSIVNDVRDSFGSLSRRSFNVRLPGHHRGKSHGSFHDTNDQPLVVQNSRWANLPPELLFDVIRRLEESENTWPGRKHVVACAAVCRSWRSMCKEIVKSPEFCGKLTFPVSLKQVDFFSMSFFFFFSWMFYLMLILFSFNLFWSRDLVMVLFSASSKGINLIWLTTSFCVLVPVSISF